MRPPSETHVGSRYGAPMGRANSHPGDEPLSPLYLRRMRINSGGYDPGGAYWGLGEPVYEAFDDNGFYRTCRAASRAAAARMLRDEWPEATFVRDPLAGAS